MLSVKHLLLRRFPVVLADFLSFHLSFGYVVLFSCQIALGADKLVYRAFDSWETLLGCGSKATEISKSKLTLECIS
jgi:hypothetical protein